MQMLSYQKIRVKFQFFDEAVDILRLIKYHLRYKKAVVRWEVNQVLFPV